MATKKKMLQAAAGAAGGEAFTAIEDVFSTYLYTGNGSTQTITNDIDLACEGGLVWVKNRTSGSYDHYLVDSESGNLSFALASNSTRGKTFDFSPYSFISSLNSDGFSIGNGGGDLGDLNASGSNYASWTFRKAPRFFDVVTYTGEPTTNKTISHNLGSVPGTIIVKRTDAVGNWAVYHRSLGATKYLELEDTMAAATNSSYWFNTEPTETQFTVGSDSAVNTDGGTYVAYLFAHDPLGPSEDGSDGLIACGNLSYSPGVEVDLGWEPQWVLLKSTNRATQWFLIDTMRGWDVDGNAAWLTPNASDAEVALQALGFAITPTGFRVPTGYGNGDNYIYIAIRRGPMRVPESGTEVFYVEKNTTSSPTFTTGFPIDTYIYKATAATQDWFLQTRITNSVLKPNLTNAEDTSFLPWDSNTQMSTGLGADYANYFFRRAPGFFDVVAYTGTGTTDGGPLGQVVDHNLGVTPELVIIRGRDFSGLDWETFVKTPNVDVFLRLNKTNGTLGLATDYLTLSESSLTHINSFISLSKAPTNYIAYLFATLPGVSKVGSYTGNGSSQTIDCGFTSGARFILIKNASVSDNWYVFDTARGIVSGADPYLRLNTNLAEASEDFVDPDLSGFSVSGSDPANNRNGDTYIFLAIA